MTEQDHLHRDPVPSHGRSLPHLLFQGCWQGRGRCKKLPKSTFCPHFLCRSSICCRALRNREEPIPAHRSFPPACGERGFLGRFALDWGTEGLQRCSSASSHRSRTVPIPRGCLGPPLMSLSPPPRLHGRNFPGSKAGSPNFFFFWPGKCWDILEWRKGHQSPQGEGSPSPSRRSQHGIPREKQQNSEVRVGSAAGKGNIPFLFHKSSPQSVPLADEEVTSIVPL